MPTHRQRAAGTTSRRAASSSSGTPRCGRTRARPRSTSPLPLRMKASIIFDIGLEGDIDLASMKAILEAIAPNQQDVMREMDLNDFMHMFRDLAARVRAAQRASLGNPRAPRADRGHRPALRFDFRDRFGISLDDIGAPGARGIQLVRGHRPRAWPRIGPQHPHLRLALDWDYPFSHEAMLGRPARPDRADRHRPEEAQPAQAAPLRPWKPQKVQRFGDPGDRTPSGPRHPRRRRAGPARTRGAREGPPTTVGPVHPALAPTLSHAWSPTPTTDQHDQHRAARVRDRVLLGFHPADRQGLRSLVDQSRSARC